MRRVFGPVDLKHGDHFHTVPVLSIGALRTPLPSVPTAHAVGAVQLTDPRDDLYHPPALTGRGGELQGLVGVLAAVVGGAVVLKGTHLEVVGGGRSSPT